LTKKALLLEYLKKIGKKKEREKTASRISLVNTRA